LNALLTAYDEQVRGYVPQRLPVGAVIEREGTLVRTHYGTYGTVHHRPLGTSEDAAERIHRQQAAFAARNEPVAWRVYSHDAVRLDRPLSDAGFVPGPEQSLLVAELADARREFKPSPGHRVRGLRYTDHHRSAMRQLASRGGPYRRELAESEADHGVLFHDAHVQLLESDGRLIGVCWAEQHEGSGFLTIQGMTGPHPEFLPMLLQWAGTRSGQRHEIRLVVTETADPAVRAALSGAGFREVSSVRSYHWTPSGPPAPDTRPVKMLLADPEYDAVRLAFQERFSFKPSITYYPAVEEPEDSVTWYVGDIGDTYQLQRRRDLPADHRVQRIQRVIQRGLRACARPGEPLFAIDWFHQGYRFDPFRVGGAGQPAWPGPVCRAGDYHKLLPADLRLGTFYHPWEESLCVFGPELLAEVEEELTEILPVVMRRGGRNTGNVWTYESSPGR